MEPYEVLGLERGASIEEVESTYKQLKENFYPGVPTETVPTYMIKSDNFAEIQKAYIKIKKDQKKIDKIAEVKVVDELSDPFGDVSFGSAYGVGASTYRTMDKESADDSKVKSNDQWAGKMGGNYAATYGDLSTVTRGVNGLRVLEGAIDGALITYGPGPKESYPVILEDGEMQGIKEFLDFSMFDLSRLGDDAIHYYSAMNCLQQACPKDAIRSLNRTDLRAPLWKYLWAIAKTMDGDSAAARYKAVEAFGAEPENSHFWALLRYIDPKAEIQRHEEDMARPDEMGFYYERKQNFKLVIGLVIIALVVVLVLYFWKIFVGPSMSRLMCIQPVIERVVNVDHLDTFRECFMIEKF